MSRALPGEHYCKPHQGNHAHYDPENCVVCRLVSENARLRAENETRYMEGVEAGKEDYREQLRSLEAEAAALAAAYPAPSGVDLAEPGADRSVEVVVRVESSDWHPIETIPVGTPVLVAQDGKILLVEKDAWWAERGRTEYDAVDWWGHDMECEFDLKPTHWMPLPAPPPGTTKGV